MVSSVQLKKLGTVAELMEFGGVAGIWEINILLLNPVRC